MGNHAETMEKRIHEILNQDSLSEAEELLLLHAQFVCFFRGADEKDSETRSDIMDMIMVIEDRVREDGNIDERTLNIAMEDLRSLTDYIVELDKPGEPEEFERFFEKVEERMEKMGEKEKPKKS